MEPMTHEALAILAILMERQGLDSFQVTYDELQTRPRALLFERSSGDIRVSKAEVAVEDVRRLQEKACEDGEAFTETTRMPGRFED